MTSTPKPDPSDDAEIENEGSSIRSRVLGPSPRAESGEFRLPAQRGVDELLRAGKILLADLPADHPRAQLLRVAVWRRDAALLRALIDELSAARSRATLLPPPRK